eukprot:TRINITY_DN20147_c0_g2_i1.p1 TRINITY_DN20147_c0_g2~~TRINITY_DN20147_c0_g2_i1.p1  ORF type:complete len:625 (-),score=65.84 TRINITY_DN20147_c0_g2_i1:214-1995(-)
MATCAISTTESLDSLIVSKCDTSDDKKNEPDLIPKKDLEEWMFRMSETFEVGIFLREFVNQSLHAILSVFSIPILFLTYNKSWQALRNRNFTVRSGPLDFVLSLLRLAAWTIFFVYRPPDVSYSELILDVVIVFLRQLTVSIKYAYMPRKTWDSMNVSPWDGTLRKSFLLVATWLIITPEVAEREAELSLVTVLGPGNIDIRMKFLPDCSDTDVVPQAIHRQSQSTRHILKNIASGAETTTSKDSAPTAASVAAAPLKSERQWHFESVEKCRDGSQSIALRCFFKQFAVAVERKENRWAIWKVACAVLPLLALQLLILPMLGRHFMGYPFYGQNTSATLYMSLVFMPNFLNVWGNLAFLLAAVKDITRRRWMVQSLAALLSTHTNDRKGVLPELRDVPMLDLSDSRTIEAMRLLYPLCLSWGRGWSMRCTAFASGFSVVTVILMAWLLSLAQLDDLTLISPTLVLVTTFTLLILGGFIVLLALIGGGVNSSAKKLSLLLQKHADAMRSPKQLWAGNSTNDIDTQEAQLTATAIENAATSILSLHEQHPEKLLGIYCGVGVLTALYSVPVIYASQLWEFCSQDPVHMRACLLKA